ncbi:MAG TPA: hypothetical protein VFI45_07935, partial [Candidatus Acidoferrum sp.]|nr:hypothetical protein [Candidatus Acidoferrum sp.]
MGGGRPARDNWGAGALVVFLSAGRSGCYLGYSLAAREMSATADRRGGGVFLVPAITYGKFELL